MPTIKLEAGNETGDLIQYLMQELDDATVDEIEIDREIEQAEGLVSEPITTAVTITLGLAAISAIVRLIERYLENQRQRDALDRQLIALKIVADGFSTSDEAGRKLSDLAMKHTNVSVSYGFAQESWSSSQP